MAQLIIRGLEEALERRLQMRAARHGQSMAAEARDILHNALKAEGQPSAGLGTRIAARFADAGLAPGEILEHPDLGEPRDPFAT